MIVERVEHPTWTSNAYLVADEDGGHGVLVDSNGSEGPLLDQVAARDLTMRCVRDSKERRSSFLTARSTPMMK